MKYLPKRQKVMIIHIKGYKCIQKNKQLKLLDKNHNIKLTDSGALTFGLFQTIFFVVTLCLKIESISARKSGSTKSFPLRLAL